MTLFPTSQSIAYADLVIFGERIKIKRAHNAGCFSFATQQLDLLIDILDFQPQQDCLDIQAVYTGHQNPVMPNNVLAKNP